MSIIIPYRTAFSLVEERAKSSEVCIFIYFSSKKAVFSFFGAKLWKNNVLLRAEQDEREFIAIDYIFFMIVIFYVLPVHIYIYPD